VIRSGDTLKLRCVPRRDRDRIAVIRVGLVRPARPQHPHPRRKRRGHIQHPFAGGDQLLREQITNATSALHRPDTRVEALRPAEQLVDLTDRRAHLDRRKLHIVTIDRDRSVRPLMRIDTDHHRHPVVLPDRRSRGPRWALLIPEDRALAPFSSHTAARSGGRAASFVSQTRTRDGRQFESQPTGPRRYGNPQRPTRILNQAVRRFRPRVRLIGVASCASSGFRLGFRGGGSRRVW
jgi:hypothetical protein